jgi:manganese/zinc/iron transport system permease protein
MTWYSIDTWIVVVGALAAVACALLGNFLVLRKMSMMGDAISHAVLPGLAVAFLVTGARASLAMFLGAAIVGILTAVFTRWISRFGKVDEGASMGIVFTTLFALGLLLIVQAADHVDLDPGCVLYGAIELTPLDVLWRPVLFGLALEVPRAALVLAGVTFFNAVFVVAFFKELRISSFDPDLATTMGIHSNLMHYLLMTLVAVTTVAAFEAVGSIIVIAMLIVPAATAHLLTDRLWLMVLLSVLIAIGSAVLGHLSALIVPAWFGFADTSSSGMMAVMAGLIFSTVMLFAPKYGVLPRLLR